MTGNASEFRSLWEKADDRFVRDRQDNHVLHALFSCRSNNNTTDLSDLLRLVHESCASKELHDLYTARNQLGCTPLWILIAYGNVDLLRLVVEELFPAKDTDNEDDDKAFREKVLPELLLQPNHQGDTPMLATSSQGNAGMVQPAADRGEESAHREGDI